MSAGEQYLTYSQWKNFKETLHGLPDGNPFKGFLEILDINYPEHIQTETDILFGDIIANVDTNLSGRQEMPIVPQEEK